MCFSNRHGLVYSARMRIGRVSPNPSVEAGQEAGGSCMYMLWNLEEDAALGNMDINRIDGCGRHERLRLVMRKPS